MPRPAVAQLVCRLIAFQAGRSCLGGSQIVNDQTGTLSISECVCGPGQAGRLGVPAGRPRVGGTLTGGWAGQRRRWQNLGDGENPGDGVPGGLACSALTPIAPA